MLAKICGVAVVVVMVAMVVGTADAASPVEKDFVEFLEGVVEGIGKEMNVSGCVPETTKAVEAFEAAVEDLDNGFKHKSVKDIYDGLKELGAGFDEVAAAWKDCGGEYAEVAEDIEKIAKQLAEPEGWIEVIIKEVINIFSHRQEVTTDIRNFVAAWKAEQYNVAGKALGDFLAVLLEE